LADSRTRTVFATSTSYTGDLGGLTGADEKCNERAQAAGLSGYYRAWLSDSTEGVQDRLFASSMPYVLTTGTKVGDGFSDLIDNSLDHSIDRDENGDSVVNEDSGNGNVWTGTGQNAIPNGNQCTDWTSTEGNGHTGRTNRNNDDWSSSDNMGCDTERRLYCFEVE
jgi:hypothetical protein